MEKICGICGTDCSGKPRVKDARGRYFCRGCAASKAAARTPTDATDPPDFDDLDSGEGFIPIETSQESQPQTSCPVCMHTLPAGARICVFCGFDAEKGVQTSTLIEKSDRKGDRGYLCRACGYDLTGVRNPICPECGERVNLSKKDRLDDGMREQVFADEYKRPAVWFVIGFVIVGVVLAIKGEPLGFAAYAVLLAIQLPLMWIGLWLCQKTFLGDVGTPLLNLVRLAGALALGNAVDEVIPLRIFFLTPGLVVFWGVLMDLFEMDLSDAIITGIIMGIIKIAGVLTLALLAADAFGLTL